jgi:hypothetical protein
MTDEFWDYGRRHSSKLNLRQDKLSDYLKSLRDERFPFLRQQLGKIHTPGMYVKDVVQPHINQMKNSDGDVNNIYMLHIY